MWFCVGVVAVCGFVHAADALDQLVGGVVAHRGADAVLRLGGHVAYRVIGISPALPVAAGEACELAERVIDIAAGQSRAVLGAALACHTPGEVVGVLQREIIRARGGLGDKVAYLVVSVDRVLLRTVRGDSVAKGVVFILGRCPVDSLDGDQTVHLVVAVTDRLAVGVGHAAAVAVAVVGITHGLAVRLRDRDQTAGIVVLVEGIALRRGDGGEEPQLVIRIGLGLLPGIVRRKNIAGLVVGIAGDMALRVRDRGDVAVFVVFVGDLRTVCVHGSGGAALGVEPDLARAAGRVRDDGVVVKVCERSTLQSRRGEI